MLAKLNPWTALVMIAFIGGVTACIITGHHLPAAVVGALGTAVAGALPKLFAGPGGAS